MYKIGDTVRLIDYRPYPLFNGEVGIISRISMYGKFIDVRFNPSLDDRDDDYTILTVLSNEICEVNSDLAVDNSMAWFYK